MLTTSCWLKRPVVCGVVAFASIQPAVTQEPRTLDCEATFPRDTSATSVAAKFGAEEVISSEIYVGEGSSEVGTVIYPNSAKDRVEILWNDSEQQREPRTVAIHGKESHWITVQGVTLGTDLRTLEQINGEPFDLAGFGWDYSGTVVAWSGGLLDAGSKRSCMIRVRLAPERKDGDPEWSRLYEQVSGDRIFSSNDPVMQELNPKAYFVTLVY